MAGFTGRAQGLQMLQNSFGQLQNAFTQIEANKRDQEIFQLEKKKLEGVIAEREQKSRALEAGVQGLQGAFAQPLSQPQEAEGPPVTPGGPLPTAGGFSEQDREQAILQAGLNLARGGNETLGNKLVSDIFEKSKPLGEMDVAKLAQTRMQTEALKFKIFHDRQKMEQSKIDLASNSQFTASKDQFARMFDGLGATAKTPEEKTRLQGFAVALSGAKDGKQVADILSQALPEYKDAATPFSALVKRGMDPLQAFKILEEIKAGAKRKGEGSRGRSISFGSKLEAIASANFDKKQFAELSAVEQQAAIDILADQESANELKAKKSEPLQAGMAKDVQAIDFTLQLGQRVIDQLRPEFVGKLNKYGNRYKDFVGTDPELSEFLGSWARFTSWILRPESGAAIGLLERKDIDKMVGTLDTESKSLLPRITNFLDIVEKSRNSLLSIATTPAAELQQTLDKNRGTGRPATTAPAAPTAEVKEEKPVSRPSGPPVKDRARAVRNLELLIPGLVK